MSARGERILLENEVKSRNKILAIARSTRIWESEAYWEARKQNGLEPFVTLNTREASTRPHYCLAATIGLIKNLLKAGYDANGMIFFDPEATSENLTLIPYHYFAKVTQPDTDFYIDGNYQQVTTLHGQSPLNEHTLLIEVPKTLKEVQEIKDHVTTQLSNYSIDPSLHKFWIDPIVNDRTRDRTQLGDRESGPFDLASFVKKS